jgi:hypothetical protein
MLFSRPCRAIRPCSLRASSRTIADPQWVKTCPVEIGLFAPGELINQGSMADQAALPFANHRALDSCPVTNIDVNPAKNDRRIGNPRDIGT